MNELSGLLTPLSPFDMRLTYHRSASFLENQWHRYDQSLLHAQLAIGILENLSDSGGLAEIWADVAATYLNQRNWAAAEDALARSRRYLALGAPAHLYAHVACRAAFLHLHRSNNRPAPNRMMATEKAQVGLIDQSKLKDYYKKTRDLKGPGVL